MKAWIVSRTISDWPLLIKISKQTLNINVNEYADSAKLLPNSLSAYISALLSMKGTPKLETAGHVLRQASCGIMVLSNPTIVAELLEIYKFDCYTVAIDNHHHLAILTGTLEQWRDAVLSSNDAYLPLLNEIVQLLEKEGLKFLWSNYQKTEQKNGTFKLIERRL